MSELERGTAESSADGAMGGHDGEGADSTRCSADTLAARYVLWQRRWRVGRCRRGGLAFFGEAIICPDGGVVCVCDNLFKYRSDDIVVSRSLALCFRVKFGDCFMRQLIQLFVVHGLGFCQSCYSSGFKRCFV